MKAKRVVLALVIAGVLGGAGISQAQIICTIPCPIWDLSAVLKHVAMIATNRAIDAVQGAQTEKLLEMARRITKLVSLTQFVISTDDTPEWRIHDWWTDAVIYAKDYHYALTYGDRSGAGFGTVTVPIVDASAVLATLSGDAAEQLRADIAQAQLADSVIIRGTDETGRIRFGSRAEAKAIDDLQTDVTDPDDEQSTTAVAEKIAGARLIAARSKQTRTQLEAAVLEQLMVDSVRARNEDTRSLNTIVKYLRDGARIGAEPVEGAPSALNSYRQP